MALSNKCDEMPPLEQIRDEPSFPTAIKPAVKASSSTGDSETWILSDDSETNNNQVMKIGEEYSSVQLIFPEESDEENTSDCEESGHRADLVEGNASPVQKGSPLKEDNSSNTVPQRWSHQMSPPRQLTAPELAAQASSSDRGGWLLFIPNEKHSASLESAAAKFLAMYPPSTVTKVAGCPVNWISTHAPEDPEEDLDEDGDNKMTNIEKLEDAWEDLNASGQQITYEKVKELARTHNLLCGKWMLWKNPGPHIDLTWERIFRATITRNLGISTKVSSALNESSDWRPSHLVCVYNRDFTDEAAVMTLEARLRGIGIRCRLVYKPDAFSYLGIYRRNEWGLSPIIYTSQFDVRKGCSTVTSVYK